MKVITVWNLKGGVGKTTTAVNLAYSLGVAGNKVLVMDLDPQTNTTPFFTKANENGRTIRNVFADSNKIKTSICKSKYENINIIKGSTLLKESDVPTVGTLATALEVVSDDYDYVVIDCRPTNEILTNGALEVANMVLTPIQLDGFCRDNLREVSNTLDNLNNKDIEWKVFVNRIRNTQSQRKIYTDLMSCQNYPIVETCISDRASVPNALFHKKPLLKHAKNNIATLDYLDLVQELGLGGTK